MVSPDLILSFAFLYTQFGSEAPPPQVGASLKKL
jgi:hypothetical protein